MPIRVLHILEATTGGTRRHLVDLVSRLNRDRFSVSVVCSTLRDPSFAADIDLMKTQGVDVTVIPMVRNISPLRDLAAFFRLYHHLNSGRYSVVHTHSSKAGFLGRLAAKLVGTPLIVHTPHVFPFQMNVPRLRKALYFRLEKLAAYFADKIICVSQSEKDAALQMNLAPAEKLTVIANGIDASGYVASDSNRAKLRAELGFSSDALVVGAIGRLTIQKGYRFLMQAMPAIVKEFPHAKLLLVGNGELKPELESLRDSHALGPHCIMVEHCDDVRPFYALFDVFVLPSLWEGLPYSLLEAMAAEKAIVATTVGGMPEGVSAGRSGMLVPPADANALAQAITDLLRDSALRVKMGAEAGNIVKTRFTLTGMVARTENLYDNNLDAKGEKG